MADQFTSIATTGYLADEFVQDALDLLVKAALREIPTARMFVDTNPGDPNMRGATITLEKLEWFDDTAITAAQTPLDEESDVDAVAMPKPSKVAVTPNEYGFVVTRTRKMAARSFTPPDPKIAMAVAVHQARVLDGLVQTTFQTGTNVRYANLHPDATTTATSVNTIAADNLLNSADLRRAVNTLRRNNAPTWGADGSYAMLSHPDTVLDLREETGADGWRYPNVYGTDQTRIWNGEIGKYEGVRFVENNLVHYADNTGSVPVYQNYLFGKGAIVEWVLEEPHAVVSPGVDRLNRFHTVGWYGDLGWKVYEDKALLRVLTSSAVGNE